MGNSKMDLTFSDDNFRTWGILWTFEFESEITWKTIRKLVRNQELALKKSRENLKKRENKEIEQHPERYNFRTSTEYGEEYQILAKMLQSQRKSILIFTFAAFERLLFDLCSMITEKFPELDSEDIKSGKSLKKYYNFLVKKFLIDKSSTESLYTKIMLHKEARIRVVHYGGIVEKSKKHKIKVGSGLELDSIKNQYQIKITDVKYLVCLTKLMEKFIVSLITSVDMRYEVLKD